MLTCTPTQIRTENNSFGDYHDNRFTIDVCNTNMSKILFVPPTRFELVTPKLKV